MSTFRFSALIAAVSILSLAACKKSDTDTAGKGGNATLNIQPAHHGVTKNLINMMILIKYNTQDAPANGVYDDSVACTIADSISTGVFTSLKNGKYYLYGHGTDTSIKENVKGGIPYTITSQTVQTVALPVSED